MELDSKGLLATVLFHSFLLIIFLLFGFKTPLPLPGEEGILLNFGDIEFAQGELEPKYNDEDLKKEQQVAKSRANPVTEKDAVMTQDFEEAPMSTQKKKVENKTQSETKVTPVTDNQKNIEKTGSKEPEVNTKALYKGRKTDTDYPGSEGVATGKGNQGSLTGSENATDHSLGTSSGDGVSFSLSGRNPLLLDKPKIDYQKEGRVVVQVKVDRSGKVVEAEPGVKGSTTLDSYLLGVAKKSALASRFDNRSDAPYYQTGTITYIFNLK